MLLYMFLRIFTTSLIITKLFRYMYGTVRFSVYGTVLYLVGTVHVPTAEKTSCKHRLFTFTLLGNNSDCPLFTCIFNGNLFSFSGWPAGTLFPFPHCAASSPSFRFHFLFSVLGEHFLLSTLACLSCPFFLTHLPIESQVCGSGSA
jgi:hypothetical protein